MVVILFQVELQIDAFHQLDDRVAQVKSAAQFRLMPGQPPLGSLVRGFRPIRGETLPLGVDLPVEEVQILIGSNPLENLVESPAMAGEGLLCLDPRRIPGLSQLREETFGIDFVTRRAGSPQFPDGLLEHCLDSMMPQPAVALEL